MKKINVAIVGATGKVGRTFLKVLEERDFPYENLYCFSSAKSAGEVVTCKGQEIVVEELTENSFDRDIDIALFSAGGGVSEKIRSYCCRKKVLSWWTTAVPSVWLPMYHLWYLKLILRKSSITKALLPTLIALPSKQW